MSLHYWTSEFAGIEIPYSLGYPSVDKWREYLEEHSHAIAQLIDEDTRAEYMANPELIRDYESEDSEIGEIAFVCDVINIESPYTHECAADADGWQYIGVYARLAYPWSKPFTWDAGLTPEIITETVNAHLYPLYGQTFEFNENITISFSS